LAKTCRNAVLYEPRAHLLWAGLRWLGEQIRHRYWLAIAYHQDRRWLRQGFGRIALFDHATKSGCSLWL
jgi:hypothetical protein